MAEKWKKPTFTKQERQRMAAKRRQHAVYLSSEVGGRGGPSTSTGGKTTTAGTGAGAPVGGNMFDPNAYIPLPPRSNPNLPIWAQQKPVADPNLGKPLIQGREFDPAYLNDVNLTRMQQAAGFEKDPTAYAQANDQYMNQEQSLIDRGMSMLGQIFNYEDEADLSLFGINLAPVESTFDKFTRHFVGAYDLLSIGMGGLISAMPGGLRTLSYDELSGGNSVNDVLDGKIGMMDNAAPSPMQIAIASVAVESKRIREGGARLSDVLLANPFTAPFILAGIAADTSPLQQEGFDIMDPAQRKQAFGSGWEQWMSGIGDAGLQLADPTIAAGWGLKVARLGLMGTRKVGAGAELSKPFLDDGLRELTGQDAESLAMAHELSATETAHKWAQQRQADLDSVPVSATQAPPEFWTQFGEEAATTELNYRRIIEEWSAAANEGPDASDAYASGLTQDDWDLIDTVGERYEIYRPTIKPNVAAQIRDSLPVRPDEAPPEFWNDMDAMFGVDDFYGESAGDYYRRLSAEDLTRDPNTTPINPNDAAFQSQIGRLYETWKTERIQEALIARGHDPGLGLVPRNVIDYPLPKEGYKSPATTLLHTLVEVLPGTNIPARSTRELMKLKGFDRLPNKGAVVKVLQSITDPYLMTLTLQSMEGNHAAQRAIQRYAPALADEIFGYWHEVVANTRYMDPAKVDSARGMLTQSRDSMVQQIETHMNTLVQSLADEPALLAAQTKMDNLQQSVDQIDALIDVMDGYRIDPIDYHGPFYDFDGAKAIIMDLAARQDAVEMALRKEVRNATASVDMDHRLPLRNNAYTRMVTNSRLRRMTAGFQYAEEGMGIFPKSRLAKVEHGVKLDDAQKTITPEYTSSGWFAPSQFDGVGRVRRAARVWRWFGTETPAGYVGLKGSSAIGSENELTAALDLDLFSGDAVEVHYVDKDGNAQIGYAGGANKRAQYIEMFTAAKAMPDQDAMTALTWIENDMMKQYALAYGFNEDHFAGVMKKADRFREQELEHLVKRGFFVDPDTMERHYVPYLKQHLANGTYMHNWHAIERHMKRFAKDQAGSDAAGKLRKIARTTGDFTLQADELFQAIWRPATLLRLGYTQRNVFEGMLRSMAYWASVAPLTWPIVATQYGVRNIARTRRIERNISKVKDRVPQVHREWTRELEVAQQEYYPLAMALPRGLLADGTYAEYYVFRRNTDETSDPIIMSADDYLAARAEAGDRLTNAENVLAENQAIFDEAVKNTAFGRWRRTQIDDLQADNKASQARLALIEQAIRDTDDLDAIDNILISARAFITAEQRSVMVRETMLNRLLNEPFEAMNMYRSQAGRQRRIGSGKSNAPDGSDANNAFADEYENLNRGRLSSDVTRKQSMSSSSDVFGNIYMHTLTKHHDPVEWHPQNREAWVEGMRNVMESNANNQLIHQMFENDGDLALTLEWLLNTAEGEKHMLHLLSLMGNDFSPTPLEPLKKGGWLEKLVYGEIRDAEGKLISKRLMPFATRKRDAVTGMKYTADEAYRAALYLEETWMKLNQQMMDNPEFLALQRRRAADMQIGAGTIPVSTDEIWDVINRMSIDEQNRLGAINGSITIEQGTAGFMETWRKLVTALFTAIGTIPEDAVVRGPFYAKRFKQVRNNLMEMHFEQELADAKRLGKDTGGLNTVRDIRKARKKATDSAGRWIPDSMAHLQFEIPAGRMSEIYEQAHFQALQDTREYMYTIDRRTKLGKYGEYIFPFISATQNSATVGGKLLWKNPWIAPLAVDLWRMPTRLGWEDEQGNIQMPMPFEWLSGFLEEHPEIPILGGIIGENDMITIPKDGLNVFMPDTGFGLIPRPAVFAQISASELFKAGALPIEAPDVWKAIVGEESADQSWSMLQDYIFGQQDTLSNKTLSWDKAVPAWIKRVIESKDELSSQYGYQFQLAWSTENNKWRAGLRDKAPTFDEIHKRTTNMFWFMALGNLGVPTPITPYPILTRPEVQKTRVEFLQERYKVYQKNDPVNAAKNFYNDYGDFALPASMTRVAKNVGGAAANPEAVSDIKALDPLIRDLAPLLGDGNMDLLDIVVNNRAPVTDYDEAAYQWEKARNIGGTDRKWRENQSPEEAELERQRITGWTEYQMFMDGLDARLAAAGLTNYESKAAIQFKMSKQRFLQNMANREDRSGWWQDYKDSGGDRTNKAILTMEKAVSDPGFRNLLIQNGKTNLLGSMDEYVYQRRTAIQIVTESGYGWNDPENMAIKNAWLSIRQRLKGQDVRFAEMMDRWLATDENPQYPGDFLEVPADAIEVPNGY